MRIETAASRNDETQRVQRRGHVDVGVLKFGYKGLRQWRPTAIVATFERHRTNGGEWSGWQREHLSWSGHTVRQDGSAGVPRSDRIYFFADSDIPEDVLACLRGWLTEVTPLGQMPDPISVFST